MKRFVGYILASLIVASLFIAIEAAVILAVAFCITDLIMRHWERRN